MKTIKDLNIEIYGDGADIEKIKELHKKGIVKGFTSNLYFLKLARVTDYKEFIKEAVKEIPELPLSFEVLANDFDTMEKEAHIIAGFGENVYVKIPIINSNGESSNDLIKRLSDDGIKLTITATCTYKQVESLCNVLSPDADIAIAILAGRIGETGTDPVPIVKKSVNFLKRKNLPKVKIMWSASREVYNVIQAEECGCDIITLLFPIIEQLDRIGTDLDEYSKEIAKLFYESAKSKGYSI